MIKIFFSESNNIINNNNELKVNLGEYAITSNYKVKVTKYELTDSFFKYNYDGYEYITFYLLVENTSNKKITKEDVNCIVDGIAQENDFSSGYSTLPFFISKGLTVQGTATFKVPKTATSYDIRYGDDVIIHVEK